jgi:hypothetical protein
MVSGIRRRSSFMITTSAASIAVSVPAAPMATPMSALSKRGCIVYAVAGHRGRAIATLQIFDGRQFVLWEKIAPGVVDAGFLGNACCGRHIVAGQHDRDDTETVQIGHCLPRTFLDGVRHRKNRQHLLCRRQHGHRPALHLVHLKARLDFGTAQLALLNQSMVAEKEELAIRASFNTSSGECDKIGQAVLWKLETGRNRF